METGLFYKMNDVGKQVDIYKVMYNPDNTALFDIEILPDNTDYPEDILIKLFEAKDMFNVAERKEVRYKDKLNVDLLLETFSTYYSGVSYGIRSEGDDNESSEN